MPEKFEANLAQGSAADTGETGTSQAAEQGTLPP
jgi:hypothetical protein